ncbi:hypothetical protein HDZ31DRAFT_39222 [Schizophyllum fasciatum]
MGKLTFVQFLKDQLLYHAPVLRKDLSGQTVVVVGANVGLGYEAAKHFATMGAARVIMACRSKERGAAAVERVQLETGCHNTELMLVDFADLNSTTKFAAELEARVDRLDLLVLNAGKAPDGTKRQETVDGWESTIQVNFMASSILALLLVPIMARTSRERHTLPRIVIVASAMHYWAKPWDADIFYQPEILKALSDQEEIAINARYQDTKLLNVLFARALNERLRSTHPSVIVNSVNPGLCSTTITRNIAPSDLPRGARIMQALLSVSAEVGSRELVWAALGGSEHAKSMRGAYVDRCAVREPSDYVLSEQGRIAQDRIWREIVSIGKKIEPRVAEIVKDHLLDL